MDKITRAISALFPGWAASRVVAQGKLALAKRYYEATQASTRRPRRGDSRSADAVVDKARGKLRDYGRWLDENHDLAVGVLDDLVTNIVGTGAGVEPMARNARTQEPLTDFNGELSRLWEEFWSHPEITGELSGPDAERLVCRSWLRDGEVFGQHLTGGLVPHHTRVPYSLELLESDFVPYDLVERGNRVVHGIQKDGWNRPVGYYISKIHPGSMTGSGKFDVVFKPAESMMHVKFTRRLHQTRGVSLFHAVLTRLDDLKDYEESERVAARVAAALTAFVKRDASLADAYSSTSLTDGESTTDPRQFSMEPGLIFDGLLPGEDVGVIDSKRPNPGLNDFRAAMLRAVAAGTGTRYSSVAKDYNGTYSAQRQELVETVNHYRRLFSYLRTHFYLPVWQRFIDASLLAGLIRLPAGADLMSLYKPEIRPPNMPWIDPKKEIEAFTLMVESGFRSRQQVIRDLGGDPSTVDAQLKADTLDVRPNISPQDDEDKEGENDEDDEDMEDVA